MDENIKNEGGQTTNSNGWTKLLYLGITVIVIVNCIGMFKGCSSEDPSDGYKPNTWYVYSEVENLQYKNCVIYNALVLSDGSISVTYYPVCKSCGNMPGVTNWNNVSRSYPIDKGYHCDSCGVQTIASLRFVG